MEKSVEMSVRSFSGMDDGLRALLSECGGPVLRDGKLYLRVDGQVYSCADTPEGRELMERIRPEKMRRTAGTAEEALLAVLDGESDPETLRKAGISEKGDRCVILFRFSAEPDGRTVRELIPTEETDRTVMTGGDLALIMQTGRRSAEEIYEFAAAAAGTMESEAGIACSAGIGRSAAPKDISGSFREAREALETGLRHKLPGRVFAYSRQIPERIADMIPPESAEALRREILPPEADRMLTPEMMETIQVYFSNDLNFSTTARQLFIHRNTLLYRMEKIRRETGLDLRKFEDAAVFRIIMGLRENGNK